MAYSKQIYDKALRIISERKIKGEREAEDRHAKAVAVCAEIAELEREMAQCAMDAPKALGMKENAKSYIEGLAKKNLEAQRKIKELLALNGLSEDYLEVKYFCPVCNDTGFVEGRKCECLKDCMRNLAFSEMSDKFPIKDSTFASFDLSLYPTQKDENGFIPKQRMAEIYEFCRSYAEDFSKNSDSLIFYGETGLGKTHLSLAIAGEVGAKGYGVVYGSAQNLLNSLENEKFGRSNTDVSAEKSILECDLLIIDDMGAEFSTQFTVAALYNVINSRILARKPVIISTNLTPTEMESKYSRRITSRIYGNYRYLIFSGKDIRQIKNMF